MATANRPKESEHDEVRLKGEWLERLSLLFEAIRSWCAPLGWSIEQVEIKRNDRILGRYAAPALILRLAKREILIAPLELGWADDGGGVDLYLLPAMDDLATLDYVDGCWMLFDQSPSFLPGCPLNESTFRRTLEETIRE